jgi:hypothetical protein
LDIESGNRTVIDVNAFRHPDEVVETRYARRPIREVPAG